MAVNSIVMRLDELERRIDKAIEMAEYAQYDGEHHKTWVIDQMVRELLDDDYEAFVAGRCWDWDIGIAP